MFAVTSAAIERFQLSRIYHYAAWLVISSLFILLISQLAVFLNVNVWRQDSLHYVSTYSDKLSEEGRWINYLFFSLLKVTPPDLCIMVSYFSLAFFTYSVVQRVVNDWHYSLALSLLTLTIPVLAVILEWPDTLVLAFVLLSISVFESKRLPDYIFFPVFSCLFFGTYSAFYFLLPLLFLDRMNWKSFLRLCLIWVISFLIGYAFTNLVVHYLTGEFIQISSWRQPHYIKSMQDLFFNISHTNNILIDHFKKYRAIITPGLLNVTLLYLLFKCRSLNMWLVVFVGLICALAIYVTAIPLGIIVQERTTLVLWVAVLCILFFQKNSSKFWRLLGLCLMLKLGIKMSVVSYESITSYANIMNSLVNQIRAVVPYPVEEVDRLYIVVSGDEATTVIRKMQNNIGYKRHFSEGTEHPMSWLSAFKFIGYRNVILCVNEETGWCAEPVAFNKLHPVPHNEGGHLFRSYRLDNDVVFTVN